jgi:hypothetical protein
MLVSQLPALAFARVKTRSIRQHYVSICQHTSGYADRMRVSELAGLSFDRFDFGCVCLSFARGERVSYQHFGMIQQLQAAYVSIRQYTSA